MAGLLHRRGFQSAYVKRRFSRNAESQDGYAKSAQNRRQKTNLWAELCKIGKGETVHNLGVLTPPGGTVGGPIAQR
jgi:hypothetical protein